MSTFTARYSTFCLSCERRIQPDDEARYDVDGNVVHAECREAPDALAIERPPCGQCFMVPSTIGVCGCDE